MSPYELMRDPFENQEVTLAMSFSGDPPEPDKAYGEAIAAVNHVRKSMRVLSFTQDAMYLAGTNDSVYGCCWARPRTWEQYAENHAGICLVFDKKELLEQLESELRSVAPYYLGEVEYTPRGFHGSPAWNLMDPDIFDPAKRSKAIAAHIERHRGEFFFLKTEDWSTEFEYRCLLLQPADTYAYVKYGDALKFVIAGEKYPAWQLPVARAVCSAAGVELKRMAWATGWPHLAKVP